MTYTVFHSKKFKKSLKRAKRRNLDISKLKEIVAKLKNDIPLDERHCDHELIGDKKGIRECHIQGDWLLEYKKESDLLILTLIDMGTHSDLFKK